MLMESAKITLLQYSKSIKYVDKRRIKNPTNVQYILYKIVLDGQNVESAVVFKNL